MLFSTYTDSPVVERSRTGWPDGYIAETRFYQIYQSGSLPSLRCAIQCRRRRRQYTREGMTEAAAFAGAIAIQPTLTASVGVIGMGQWDGDILTQTVSTGTATAEHVGGLAWRIVVDIDYDSWEPIT